MRFFSVILATAFCVANSDAFAPQTIQHQTTALYATEDRRAFFGSAAAAFVAGGIMTAPAVVFAEGDSVDDLAMPSEEEQKASEKAAMEERLRKKAELQKKAARPQSYGASMAAEKNKQKELQKSQAERRAALCEELGRGC
mmetsp:Transcript_7510/g.8168  ORF Transcript_7510/g.8168 Transcript_7510/m.8168 type:complete len:141 (+) Transcript_7510:56-478(+)